MGKNPITKTIKLKTSESSSSYLELKTDGTALYISEKEGPKTILSEYKYTYDAEKGTITMRVEKTLFGDELMYVEGASEVDELLTYDETCSKINEWYTVKNIRNALKKLYEDKEWLEKSYPGCNSYDDFEAEFIKEVGYKTLDEFVKDYKRMYENYLKAEFSAQITYAYKTENDKMALTEKFTGVKNLVNSRCRFSDESSYVRIDCGGARIEVNDDDYHGTVDTDEKTISFESEDRKEKVTATYTENISAGTVTIKFKDKEYICEFEGEKYIQVE